MRQKSKKGIKNIIMSLFGAIIVVLIMIFAMLLLNNYYNRQIVNDSIEEKADLYIEFLNTEFIKISKELTVMSLKDENDIDKIPLRATAKDAEYYKLWDNLKNYNATKESLFETKYNFFEYGYDADVLIYEKAVYFSDTNRDKKVESVTEIAKKKCESHSSGVHWDFFAIEKKSYLCGTFQYLGKVVGCVVDIDNLVKNFKITNLGYEGFLLFEKAGKYYSSEAIKLRDDIDNLILLMNKSDSESEEKYAWYTYDLNEVGNVKVVTVLSNGVLERMSIFQMLLSIIFALIVVIALYMMWYLSKNVLNPMRDFIDKLKNPDNDVYLNERDDSGALEFVYASDKFKSMYREIQRLRIDLYEKELAEKNMMLEYAQEQIRPHFFLNCMSVVQSMAELRKEEDIVNILDVVSDYMRYVLKDTFEMRYIQDEIEHLQKYMDIQALCKPGAFTYEAIVEDDLEKSKILPLILQVFVENSVKHALVADKCIEISLYITKETINDEENLYIVISDTGCGFPNDILEKIERDESIVYDGCEHVGIRNTIKRIKMQYKGKAKVKLSNVKENFGAVVEITIPINSEN